MRIVIIGGVAAGTSAAAKARRNNEAAEIIIYERDQDISYSACGLPYYIGGEVESIDDLRPRDASFFKQKYDIDVKTEHEVVEVSSDKKSLLVKDLTTGKVFGDTYDKLVIATGASAFVPPIEGADLEHVFVLRNVQNALAIKRFVDERKPKRAVIVGTGFIGLELLENLRVLDIHVTLVEVSDKITPNLDVDMAMELENRVLKKGVQVIKSVGIQKITPKEVKLTDGSDLQADMVILATGVRANTSLAVAMGVELGETKAIRVNEQMQTSIEDVYACGDCIETFSVVTGKPYYRPLGTTANKTGRIAGDALTGGRLTYRGNLSTSIFKLFDLTIATTGLSEKEALEEGYSIEISHNKKQDRPSYFDGEEMMIKAIADRESQRLLGIQIIGKTGVDKRIDVFATLITYKAKVEELFHLDLAYAPPFSTTKDPVHYTGMLLDNALNSGDKV